MNKTIFITGVVLGALAVVLGAFAAHGLEERIDATAIGTFETGAKYQMYHALLLLILANLRQIPEASKKGIFYVLLTGVIMFSFSLYFLATNSLTAVDFRAIGFITPIGGLFLIMGWGLLGFGCLRHFN